MTDILAANSDLTAFISTGALTQWYDNAYRRAVEQVNVLDELTRESPAPALSGLTGRRRRAEPSGWARHR